MRRPLFVDEARPTGSVPYQARDPIACGTHDMDTWSETDLDATKNKVPTVARVDMGLSPLLSQGGGCPGIEETSAQGLTAGSRCCNFESYASPSSQRTWSDVGIRVQRSWFIPAMAGERAVEPTVGTKHVLLWGTIAAKTTLLRTQGKVRKVSIIVPRNKLGQFATGLRSCVRKHALGT